MFPSLSNSLKIRSHLETSKVNFSSSCQPLVASLRDAQELALDYEGHTNSATYTSFSSSELSEHIQSYAH
jgi:hypothetical protein